MAAVLEYTETTRREIFLRGSNDLFFFCHGLLGMRDLSPSFHAELCHNLQGVGEWGDWRRAMVCASRGFLKSSISTVGYSCWKGIYQVNHSTRILGSSYDNAKSLFFEKISDIFRKGGNSSFLYWLFNRCICEKDPKCPFCGGMGKRIPDNFLGCSEEQFEFVRSDPMAHVSISFKGHTSAQQGYHGNLIIIDDPEGADAEKKESVQVDATRAVDHSVPLLIDPNRDRILLVLTPHGPDPLAWRIREYDSTDSSLPKLSADRQNDNDRRFWKVWWKPLVDGEGNPNWPQRFNEKAIDLLRTTTRRSVFWQQYLLKKSETDDGYLNFESVEKGYYRWKIPPKITSFGVEGLVEYPVLYMDREKWEQSGELEVQEQTAECQLKELRFFIHVDLTHRADTLDNRKHGTNRPSQSAFVVTAVTPDFHVLVIAYWTKKASIDEQVAKLYSYYRDFAPSGITFDRVGAQVWFKDFIRQAERNDARFQSIESSGRWGVKRLLPSLSSRMIEDVRKSGVPKEEVVSERLQPWIESVCLHLHHSQDELIHQVRGFPHNTNYVDLVDALAQGPPVWKPGYREEPRLLSQKVLLRQIAARRSGYFNPWRVGGGQDPFGRVVTKGHMSNS